MLCVCVLCVCCVCVCVFWFENCSFVGADISAACRQAAAYAIKTRCDRQPRPNVTQSQLLHAVHATVPSVKRDAQLTVARVTWDDIGGLDDVKLALQKVCGTRFICLFLSLSLQLCMPVSVCVSVSLPVSLCHALSLPHVLCLSLVCLCALLLLATACCSNLHSPFHRRWSGRLRMQRRSEN